MTDTIEDAEYSAIQILNPNDLPKLWPILEPMVIEACSYSIGDQTPISVIDGVMDGRYRMLVYMNKTQITSFALLTVSIHPSGMRTMEVLLASGENLKDWKRHFPEVNDYARENGCERFRIIGRKGLARMLPDWKQTSVVLEKKVGIEQP